MEPLNKTERSKAFVNFLIFFIVTIAFVIAAVFFSIQVPFTENKKLTEQMRVIEAERLFTQKFESNMNEVMRLLDDLNKKDVDATLTVGKIEGRINTMSSLIETDSSYAADAASTSVKDLYTSVVANLSQLLSAKKEIREAANKDANLTEYKQEISNLKSELSNTKQTLNLYQIQLANAGKSN